MAMSRLLHWSMPVVVPYQLPAMGVRAIFDRQPWRSSFVSYQQSVGTTLFALIVVRVFWVLSNCDIRPEHGRHLFGRAASLSHGLLDVAMLAVPAIALIRAYGKDRVLAPFGFTILPAQEPTIKWMAYLAARCMGNSAGC